METKFKESVFKTSVIEEMKGLYLAERLLRGWEEDFVDEDTGNVVSIKRNEILFEKGVLLDNDVLTEVNFYLQSGDVKEVSVSNQKRTGLIVEGQSAVYCVTVLQGNKKKNYYLYANSVGMAMRIITDFLEQKIQGAFSFSAIKEMGFSNLVSMQEEIEAEGEAEKDFYKIEVELLYEGSEAFESAYILRAKNAEEAKEMIIRFISLKMIEEDREVVFEVAILSAKTIPCKDVVDFQFAKEYFENEKN